MDFIIKLNLKKEIGNKYQLTINLQNNIRFTKSFVSKEDLFILLIENV